MTSPRLLPIVLFALVCLLALKGLDLLGRGGVEVGGPAPAFAGSDRPAQPDPHRFSLPADPLVTGSAEKEPAEEAAPVERGATDTEADAAEPAAPVKPVDSAAPLIPLGATSPAERALLERLQDRREQLDQQARELDMRENLLKAAEKRIEERIGELKQIESRVGTAQQRKEEEDQGRMKSLVVMYEAMKAKDAARIFDRLDQTILVDVVSAMKPAKVADILAAMESEAAQRLTVALANKARPKPPGDAAGAEELPKIEGTMPNG